MAGKVRWFFPDAELPPPGDADPRGHESIIILNPNPKAVRIRMTLWYTDRGPDHFEVSVEGERVRCLRTDVLDDMGGHEVMEGQQYAIGLESDGPIIAQYGRLDVRQPNMAFYSTPGYSE